MTIFSFSAAYRPHHHTTPTPPPALPAHLPPSISTPYLHFLPCTRPPSTPRLPLPFAHTRALHLPALPSPSLHARSASYLRFHPCILTTIPDQCSRDSNAFRAHAVLLFPLGKVALRTICARTRTLPQKENSEGRKEGGYLWRVDTFSLFCTLHKTGILTW